jgi:hypothetical protein
MNGGGAVAEPLIVHGCDEQIDFGAQYLNTGASAQSQGNLKGFQNDDGEIDDDGQDTGRHQGNGDLPKDTEAANSGYSAGIFQVRVHIPQNTDEQEPHGGDNAHRHG